MVINEEKTMRVGNTAKAIKRSINFSPYKNFALLYKKIRNWVTKSPKNLNSAKPRAVLRIKIV
ncbi:hypothetical protein QT970_08665 [Microcoleus sp. herbarium8]|uniref:hypothetical protein n=1 Tax=Microcoleus sp. herbarium8 TaxID=3055436 RepID=UPI002FD280F5